MYLFLLIIEVGLQLSQLLVAFVYLELVFVHDSFLFREFLPEIRQHVREMPHFFFVYLRTAVYLFQHPFNYCLILGLIDFFLNGQNVVILVQSQRFSLELQPQSGVLLLKEDKLGFFIGYFEILSVKFE